MEKFGCKMAVLDLSKGSKGTVLVNDVNGVLREASEEETIHRSWNRHNLRKKERLLKMNL